jgi:cytochrome c oxidase cbb3-type subunit 3
MFIGGDVKSQWKNRCIQLGISLVATVCVVQAQAPGSATIVVQSQAPSTATPKPKVGENATVSATPAAVRLAQEDATAVKRGGDAFVAGCGSCHGATAKGTDIAPDLIRSTLVEDDVKGNLIGPVLRTEHPKGKPRPNLTDQQISDIVAWLRVQVYGAAFRQTYTFLDPLVGDAKKGATYFNANCASCHSATGDMAGIGGKYDTAALQFRWITGGGGGRSVRSISFGKNGSMTADITPPHITKTTITITVTLASGEKLTGIPVSITDFNVAFKDMAGVYHSYARDGEFPKVETHDPLKPHADLAKILKDDDMHDVTAYLVTLK